MATLRGFLILIIVALAAYTLMVGINHGWNLFPVFFGDIAAMTWAGQFNADFLGFLLLSGLWLSWRHHFSPAGLALGVAGVLGGMMLLAPYLVDASVKANGDIRVVLLGPDRAAGRPAR